MSGLFGGLGAMGGSLLSAAGNYFGMDAANDQLNYGKQQYNQYANQGIDTMKQGQSASTNSYLPYTQAGETGVSGLTAGITGRQNAPMAQVTDNSAGNAIQNYLNPSAAYSTDQANKAMEASAIASGGMGGGLAKALSNNANQMAMTNYNNAYNQMLQGNAQTFGQQNQNYQNQTAYDQSQIQNYQNLAGLGLNANSANQANQLAYNNEINENYNNMADTAWNTAASKANNFQTGINNMFGNVGNSMAQGGSAFDSLYGLGG